MRKFIKGNNNDDTEGEIVGCRKAISRALQGLLFHVSYDRFYETRYTYYFALALGQ